MAQTANPLVWTVERDGSTFDRYVISGFTTGERWRIRELHDTDYVLERMEETVPGIGMALKCGYGVYGLAVVGEDVYLTVGASCD